ncbi:MAG TPA: hypothetical protein VHY20_12495, partial [Pirellulales bacterium]|nr:hypothetical protein [Pirellulales bacterium]
SVNPPPGGVWIYRGILARSPVTWDDRALPLLLQVIGPGHDPGLDWEVVPSFNEKSRLPEDTGSYFVPFAPDIEHDLPRLAAGMCRLQPKTSVKFIVRLDRRPPTGIVRLDFDYKGTRGGWIRRAGSSAGQPVQGFGSIAPDTQLSPSLPRAVGPPAKPTPTPAVNPAKPKRRPTIA